MLQTFAHQLDKICALFCSHSYFQLLCLVDRYRGPGDDAGTQHLYRRRIFLNRVRPPCSGACVLGITHTWKLQIIPHTHLIVILRVGIEIHLKEVETLFDIQSHLISSLFFFFY